MKRFQQNQNNFFICEECGLTSISKHGIINHIVRKHKAKEYFDKYIRENEEGLCKICNKETVFNNIAGGYKTCCKGECEKKWNQIRTEEEVFKKFGVKNVFQSKKIKNKIKKIKKQKYNDEYYTNRKKSKETTFKNYGCEWGLSNKKIREKGNEIMINLYGEHPLKNKKIKTKKQETSLKKYGTVSPNSSNVVKTHKINSCLKKYDVENPMQNKEIFEKQQKSGLKAKNFKNTNIYYRGSYELDFLEKFYDKYPDIQNGSAIKYKYENKNKIYFPDFYIPSLNLIIECKSKYYYNRFEKQNKKKEKYTKALGYTYLIIIDKDYTKIKKYENIKM